MSVTVLFSEMRPDPSWEVDFNGWYNTEHIPVRMKVPGFIGAQRYKELESNKYLAVYEMESADVLNSEAYQNVKTQPSEQTRWMLKSVSDFTRYIGYQISEQRRPDVDGPLHEVPILYPVFFRVPPEREQEFSDWYEEDHVPTLLKNEQWLACRRFRITIADPGQWTHLALHYLTSTDALQSKEREEARKSPRRAKLASEDWFKGHYMLFERIGEYFEPVPR